MHREREKQCFMPIKYLYGYIYNDLHPVNFIRSTAMCPQFDYLFVLLSLTEAVFLFSETQPWPTSSSSYTYAVMFYRSRREYLWHCVCALSLELKIPNKTKNWGVFRTLTPKLTHAYINPIFLQKLCQEKYYLLFTFHKSVLVVQNQSIPLD